MERDHFSPLLLLVFLCCSATCYMRRVCGDFELPYMRYILYSSTLLIPQYCTLYTVVSVVYRTILFYLKSNRLIRFYTSLL